MIAAQDPQGAWREFLRQGLRNIRQLPPPVVEGQLTRMVGLTLEAAGCQAAVGDRCEVSTSDGSHVEAEVVGFAGDRLFLMPTGDIHGVKPSARVIPLPGASSVKVGPELLGRIIDAAGEPLDVGVRAINALLTVGRGQRVGLFAGSGVGKSVLLGMMARYTNADVVVVGLIGERGREVKEFVERILGEEGLRRSVVVAAPADHTPLMRLHGAWMSTAIAEYYRDQGLNVLLIMDSLTRFAQAQREIGLAIGEAPATKGYPPSVFARLPALVERAGNGASGSGSITAFYTVLTEGDDQQDPIADSARAILDGHIVLSRRIAEAGQYPAIDVEASISRVMHEIVPDGQFQAARRFKQALSTWQQNRDLVSIGAYQRGSDPRIDAAIAAWPDMQRFLMQGMHESVSLHDSVSALAALCGDGG